MSPENLIKGELYQADMLCYWANDSTKKMWDNQLVVYLGNENPKKNKQITNYLFLVREQQRLTDRSFLRFIKEIK
tara:strand:- start:185 stop:409 length:225 start_codon:yes stop_codon:yes gene_type:complete